MYNPQYSGRTAVEISRAPNPLKKVMPKNTTTHLDRSNIENTVSALGVELFKYVRPLAGINLKLVSFLDNISIIIYEKQDKTITFELASLLKQFDNKKAIVLASWLRRIRDQFNN